MINEVSLQYAKSLYELSKDLDQDLNDLEVLKSCISNSNELVKVLMHPSISKEEKKELFKNLLSGKIEDYFLYFIYVLVDNERILELENIYDTFKMLVDEKKNILNCEVVSKYPLDKNIKEDLIKYLSQKYQKEIKLKETINDELIGGIKVIVQNEVIDYTFDSTLTNLKNTIKG